MPNRLKDSASPYLRQHQENPVDWYPWGDEAFEKATKADRPIFLSIGYSSCHWCHVMAHESFESGDVAALMNKSFVCVKVDREERPDVDEAYMTFVQLLTGRGGWPTSVFLTPKGQPFFGGTYWPRDHFAEICERVFEAWRTQRAEIEQSADHYAAALAEALQTSSPGDASDGMSDRELVENAVRVLAGQFDATEGGFDGAPKFPPHTALRLLLSIAEEAAVEESLKETAREMALFTLRRMSLGGIHDHVGGGFHRYSTDAKWHLPHFEKMLYDNALLLENYARAARYEPEFRGVADGIVKWLAREMRSEEGLFFSALDADSPDEQGHSVEGKFYTWTWKELEGLPDLEGFAEAYQCRREGNFRDEASGRASGENVLHRRAAPGAEGTGQRGEGRGPGAWGKGLLAEGSAQRAEGKGQRAEGSGLGVGYEEQLRTLRERRSGRARPGLDDKALVGWNGLAISGLAEAHETELAETCGRAILQAEKEFGRLPHMIVRGRPMGEAFLEDYAYFILGLSRLGTEFEADAERLAREMIEKFWDEAGGGFFSTAADASILFGRVKPVLDQPLPSGNAAALSALSLLSPADRDDKALRTLVALRGWMERAPQATGALIAAALIHLQGAGVMRYVSWEVVWTGAGRGVVSLTIGLGYHLNSREPKENWMVPTVLESERATFEYPEGERYEGTVEFPFALTENYKDLRGTIQFQACTESECFAPHRIWFQSQPL